jgi:hypothetical protein
MATGDGELAFWVVHAAIHSVLQSGEAGGEAARKQIDAHFDWLLHGLALFKPPSEASRRQLDQRSVSFKGKKLSIETRLRNATIKLSALLVGGRDLVAILDRFAARTGSR